MAIAFGEGYDVPQALDEAGIREVVERFAAAARRAQRAGFEVAEVHAAHGYLLHQFQSPLSNQRTDAHGSNLKNRSRLLREALPPYTPNGRRNRPLALRLSATDWVEGGLDIEETVEVCRMLKGAGCPSTCLPPAWCRGRRFPPTRLFDRICRAQPQGGRHRHRHWVHHPPAQASHILRSGQAAVVLLGRKSLRDPYWPLAAARDLGRL